jgi:hypothetical protein
MLGTTSSSAKLAEMEFWKIFVPTPRENRERLNPLR